MKKLNLLLLVGAMLLLVSVTFKVTYEATKEKYGIAHEDMITIGEGMETMRAIRERDSLTFREYLNRDVTEAYFVKGVRNNMNKTQELHRSLEKVLSKYARK